MSEEKSYSENLSETLNLLSDKLGVKADQLFDTVIKQARIEFYMDVIYLIFYVALFVLGIKGFEYVIPLWMDKAEFSNGKQASVMLISLTSIVFICIPLFCTLSIIHEMITLKLNPKYWALKNILSNINND